MREFFKSFVKIRNNKYFLPYAIFTGIFSIIFICLIIWFCSLPDTKPSAPASEPDVIEQKIEQETDYYDDDFRDIEEHTLKL